MIFQEPMTSLNPVLTVGYQLAEALRYHETCRPPRGRAPRALELLDQVGIPAPERGSATTRTSSPAACGSA